MEVKNPKNEEKNDSDKSASWSKREFPLNTLKVAEEVLKAVKTAGGQADIKILETTMNIKGGGLARKIASARRWGLIKGTGSMSITELGKSILYPVSEEEAQKARQQAFAQIELFSKLHQRFGSQVPAEPTFVAVLVREFQLEEKDAKTVVNIYKDSVKNFLPASGSLELMNTGNQPRATEEGDMTAQLFTIKPGQSHYSEKYTLSIKGPDMSTSFTIESEEDLLDIDLIINRIKRKLNAHKRKPDGTPGASGENGG